MITITTLEPIEITAQEHAYGDSQVDVYIDEVHYMSIRHVDLDDLDTNKVREFIEHTYYDSSYQCSQYVAGYYSSENFI